MTDPLTPYLLDIIDDPAGRGLILAGGLGMLHKQEYLQRTRARTLIEEIPAARATVDIDLVVRVELWMDRSRAPALRALLERLGYEVRQYNWQFVLKQTKASPSPIRVDLMARRPTESEGVNARERQVGRGMGTGIGGFLTPEAFAVEEGGLPLEVTGASASGKVVAASIVVPHPYAWINMKLQAGHDWLREQRGEIARKRRREKHVFDVYVLTAMLTEAELREAEDYAAAFATHPAAQQIKEHAIELFGSRNARGTVEAERQCGGLPFHYDVLWQALHSALGIRR